MLVVGVGVGVGRSCLGFAGSGRWGCGLWMRVAGGSGGVRGGASGGRGISWWR